MQEFVPGRLRAGPVLRLYKIDPERPSFDRERRFAAAEALLLDTGLAEISGMAAIHGTGASPLDDFEIDGKTVPDVCRAAASFGWPAASTPYSVRQFYLLVPGSTPAGAVPAPPAEAASGDTDR